jgi:HAD superfamily hydrolase (TIGR01490 family)
MTVNDLADSPSLDLDASGDRGIAAGVARSVEQGGDAGMAPAVAFFDLDGTLVVGQTTLLLTKFMHRAGVLGWGFVLGTALWFLGYKLGIVKLTRQARERGAGMLKGLTEAEADALMTRFVDEELVPRLHPAATAALAEHLAEGDHVVVVSAALEPGVRAFCRYLGVSDFVGTGCETVGGRYTGRLKGPIPHGDEKIELAAEYMARWGADPADCWAYADHSTDIALLRSVGHPVAVNARPALLTVAQEEGWPIVP